MNPESAYNKAMIIAVYNILAAPQNDNFVVPNLIRKALRSAGEINTEQYKWVLVDNVYTYGLEIIKSELSYSFLTNSFQKLLEYSESTDLERLQDLADALHNVPILIADGCNNFKRAVKTQFACYNKKHNTDLWKELAL